MPCGCAVINPTFIAAGSGVTVSGTGTETNPYRIAAATSEAATSYRETTTAKLSRTGQGTVASPYEVKADVKLDAQGGLAAGQNGIGVRIDTASGNILRLNSDGTLRAAGSAAVQLSETGGLQDTDTGLAIKLSPTSPLPIQGTTDGLTVGPLPTAATDALTTRINVVEKNRRLQQSLLSGGTKYANQTHVKWDADFFAIPPRRESGGPSFFRIGVPANGVTITGIGGASSVTVPTSGSYVGMVPLADWTALYYFPDTAATVSDYVPANLRVVGYTAIAALPDTAILIAQRDGAASKAVRWGDDSWSFPWRNHATSLRGPGGNITIGSGGFQRLRYRVRDNWCEIQFQLRWGTNGSAPGGDLYLPLPVTSAPAGGDIDREYIGPAKFVSAAGGDWPGLIWLPPLGADAYFLLPTHESNCTVKRYRTWDGSNGDGSTAIPRIAPNGAVPNSPAGSALTASVEYPVYAPQL